MEKNLSVLIEYLYKNIEELIDVKVLLMPEDIKEKQEKDGIKGMTHILVLKFPLGEHAISINATSKSKKGWAGVVNYIKESYLKYLKDCVKAIDKAMA
jgi:hypothetical protein